MGKTRICMIVLTAVCLIAAVVGIFVLPDTLVVQINELGESGNQMPKLVGLLIPLAIAAFAFLYGKEKNDGRALIISVVAVVMYAFTFIVNL